jgi:hypothetical protein
MKILPVAFRWQEVEIVDDEHGELRRVMAMVPLPRFGNLCKRQFEAAQEYALVPHETRSTKSHSFFFACVNEAFQNLPEKIAARFPSAEHLRAWCLIECGWFDEKEFEFETKKQAFMLCTFLQTQNPYARMSPHQVAPNKWKVLVRVAKSQSYASMNKADFEASKKAVLDLLEEMTRVPRGTFHKETNRHA